MSRPADEPAEARTERHLLRSSAVVAMGTGLSRVTGFLRVAVMAYAIGATALAEAYNLANNTPNLLYDLVLGGILSATLVPVIVAHHQRGDEEAIDAVATVILVVLMAATVVSIACAPLIIGLFNLSSNPGQAGTQALVAVPLLMLFAPQILFYGLSTLGTALLNARRSFAVPAFAPVLNNLIVISLFLALPRVAGGTSPSFDQVAEDRLLLAYIGVGTTFGIVAMTAVLWPAMRVAGIRLHWRFEPRHRAVREIGRLSGWTLGYVLSNLLAFIVIQTLANGVDGVTEYAYAYIFFQLPYGLWTVSVMTAYTPEMAAAWARGDLTVLRDRFAAGFRLLPIVILPMTIGLVALAHPIIDVVLGHGAFDQASADLTARTLIAFSVGLPGFSIYLYVMRGFYALRDTRTPFLINLAESIANVLLALLLVDRFGVVGLAASFAAAYTVFALISLAILRRRIGGIFDLRTRTSMGKQLTAGVVMLGSVLLAGRLLRLDQFTESILVGTIGIIVYSVALLLLRPEESELVIARLRRNRP